MTLSKTTELAQATKDLSTEGMTNEGLIRAGRRLSWLITITGLIGLLGAAQLTLEKIEILKNPDYIPSCTLNPIFSCGNVMNSWQAAAFGKPNTVIGIAAFAVVATIGVSILAGASYKRWFWIGLNLGALFGVCFNTWLMAQSFYEIGNLCLYCMVVWIATIPLFVGVTLFNLRNGVWGGSQGIRDKAAKVSPYGWVIVVVWYAIIVALLIIRFPGALTF